MQQPLDQGARLSDLGQRVAQPFLAGERWSDHPHCTHPLLASVARMVNDNTPDAGMIRAIHRGIPVHPELSAYPAHLHIDLPPHAVGQGWGRRMMAALLARLRELRVPGVHLGVGIGNQRAIAFYERCGFARLHERQWGILFGMLLDG